MCDYSLQHVKSRAANVGDKLITKDFGTGTIGFAEFGGDAEVAVCVLPGTEIAFDEMPRRRYYGTGEEQPRYDTAIFRQVDVADPLTHHDALEFPDGHTITLTNFQEGQRATVLQLPAAPKTEAEAKAQERLEVVA